MGVPSRNPPKNLPPIEDYLRAKFRPDPSSRLDFYREQTDTQTDIALYVLDKTCLDVKGAATEASASERLMPT